MRRPLSRRPLRIRVSSVAQVTGYHSWTSAEDAGQLLLDAIYQDESLRAFDMATFGLRLLPAEQEMAETLSALSRTGEGGRVAAAGFSSILCELSHTNGVEATASLSQRTASLAKAAVLEGSLGSREASRLEGAVRSAVYTDFGTRHESNAISLYEKQTGREVRESNEALMLWPWLAARCAAGGACLRLSPALHLLLTQSSGDRDPPLQHASLSARSTAPAASAPPPAAHSRRHALLCLCWSRVCLLAAGRPRPLPCCVGCRAARARLVVPRTGTAAGGV